MPASPTRTRPSTAGKTTSTTTSASSPRARTLLPAASSCWHTSPSAPTAGHRDGTTSVRPETSPSSSTSKQLAPTKRSMLEFLRAEGGTRVWHLHLRALYHSDRYQQCSSGSCSSPRAIRAFS